MTEKRRKYVKKYNLDHKEKNKEYHKKYNQDPINKQRTRKYQKKWRSEHKERIKEKNKIHHFSYRDKRREKELKEKYGINTYKYNELLLKQNNVCAICLKSEILRHKNGEIKRLSVDHDHKTGKVRGLLCVNCNVALGGFKDNSELLKKAIDYLKIFEIL